jgi:hypothetical protein
LSTWATTRDAIQGAIVAASGIPADAVLWKYQDAGQPPLPYIALALGRARGVGRDAIVEDYDAARPAGQEIRRRLVGLREVVLSLECYTADTVSGDAPPGALLPLVDSEELCERIRSSFALPSMQDRLWSVDVSVFDIEGSIQTLPTIALGLGSFRGRSVLDLRCYMPAPALAEYVGIISQVTTTIHVADEGNPLDIEVNTMLP